ncbi:MAG TPA: CDP-alcohol phosphatidyltransferase family protein [Cytophagaceae bacterium]|jgi:CDP-diacylglycerol--serine O-phosphatidyltransferase|nr:CDP-alcohol phosphatidyltransferase family protein [Cytophagaceae bacterium]
MNIKKHIPNFLTCCNLFCGCLGIIFAFQLPDLSIPCYLIFAACVFDFLDGFVARLLKVQSPIGKELDSLADVMTFGVLPGILVFQLFQFGYIISARWNAPIYSPQWEFILILLPFIALLIPIFSALRLAKFNIDTRQSESFIGVPTPANAILIASIPLILWQYPSMVGFILNPYFLIGLTLLMSYLLVAELPLFALKFKNLKWTGNEIRFIFLGLSILLLAFLKWLGIPIIIFLYIILSVVNNVISKKAVRIDSTGLK